MATSRSSPSPSSISGGPAYHPATCMSEYGVVLGEEAVPFVVATDLAEQGALTGKLPQRRLAATTAAVVGIALHRALMGARRRESVGGAWAQTALREMTEQRR